MQHEVEGMSKFHQTSERDLASARPSPADVALLQELEAHVAHEEEVLDEYRRLAAGSIDPAVEYLVTLILEDEERHHRILVEMLNQVRTGLWLAEQGPRVPSMSASRQSKTLGRAVKRLRAFERADLRRLRRLRHRLGGLRRHSLDGVLVESLKLDTRKHLVYLRVLARLAREGSSHRRAERFGRRSTAPVPPR
jgi:hypothetical protein